MINSVIVPCFNNSTLTLNCIASILSHTSDSTEIILVDDHSQKTDFDLLLKKLPSNIGHRRLDIYRMTTNSGFSKACNQGAVLASRRSEKLIFLNNDTIVCPKWLDYLVENLTGNIGICGSKLLYPENTFSTIHNRLVTKDSIQHAGIMINNDLAPFHIHQFLPANTTEANVTKTFPYVTGASLAIRNELFQELGGFSEKYHNGCEDLDLCVRVRATGALVLYCHDSTAFHYETATRNPESSQTNLDIFIKENLEQLKKDREFSGEEF